MNYRKCVLLFSGGLDSFIAYHLLREQGIDITLLSFSSPFFALKEERFPLGSNLYKVRLREDYLKIIKNPKYGYGKNLNPCIDCRIFMLKEAKRVMGRISAEFVVTGEVLGQRPMSQRRYTFNLIEKEAGLKGLILRPLSAKLLKETVPEKEGTVCRDKLLSIQGRPRKEQIALSEKYGIKNYLTPAGGCLLTDSNFCRKLKNLMESSLPLSLETLSFLKLGRYFSLSDKCKFIVSRNEGEGIKLRKMAQKKFAYIEPVDKPGPFGVILSENLPEDLVSISAEIIAYYTDRELPTSVRISLVSGKERTVSASPCRRAPSTRIPEHQLLLVVRRA